MLIFVSYWSGSEQSSMVMPMDSHWCLGWQVLLKTPVPCKKIILYKVRIHYPVPVSISATISDVNYSGCDEKTLD